MEKIISDKDLAIATDKSEQQIILMSRISALNNDLEEILESILEHHDTWNFENIKLFVIDPVLRADLQLEKVKNTIKQ